MVIDVLFGVLVVFLGLRSTALGGFAAAWQLLTAALAGVAARIVAAPTARYIVTGIDWSPGFSRGVCFLVYFSLLLMTGHFLMSRVVEAASENYGDGGSLDRAGGFLLGAGRGAVVGYGVLCSIMLMTPRLGSNNELFALPYTASKVALYVLPRNVVDPEPFPHARALRAMFDAEDVHASAYPYALTAVRGLEKAQVVEGDSATLELIFSQAWKPLRGHRDLLALVTDRDFAAAADKWMTPNHKVRAEEPEDRFDELNDAPVSR